MHDNDTIVPSWPDVSGVMFSLSVWIGLRTGKSDGLEILIRGGNRVIKAAPFSPIIEKWPAAV